MFMMESDAPSVDHYYKDFANYIKDGGVLEKHKKSENNFPAILHKILSDEQCSGIISWMPHGRSWKLHNNERLVDYAIPKFFRHTIKLGSFNRQLSGWGFKRLQKPGPGEGESVLFIMSSGYV
jgi:hypothetical protein